jgi:hypothetical protein
MDKMTQIYRINIAINFWSVEKGYPMSRRHRRKHEIAGFYSLSERSSFCELSQSFAIFEELLFHMRRGNFPLPHDMCVIGFPQPCSFGNSLLK